MSYADNILSEITMLREVQVDLISAGQTNKAEHLQRAIEKLFDSYQALTGDVD